MRNSLLTGERFSRRVGSVHREIEKRAQKNAPRVLLSQVMYHFDRKRL